jgi:pantoate--beta-alanine ligase
MAPAIVTNVEETRRAIADAKRRGKTIGFVPTMGALHAGHASLIKAARAECGFVVVSIFVNPTQFGPNEDLSRYPRPFENDVKLCETEQVDLIFHPTPEIMYPSNFRTFVEVEELQDVLCGQSRPGHFRGVATVVLKLCNIVLPDVAYFGQKDAQQARVLIQMVRDLDVPVQVRICSIVRESDGLALSSRNVYLTAEQRRNATVLYRALETIRQSVEQGERDTDTLLRRARAMIEPTPGAVIDYVEAVDYESLRAAKRVAGKVLFALAVRFGTTRLIDNVIVDI